MENIFGDSLAPYIGQKQMISRPIQHIGEIYKIHGSISDPSSMILTDSDYGNFIDYSHYLSAILTKTFVEHPVFFFGYSISDPNIRLILSNVVRCMDEEAMSNLADRLIFVNRLGDGDIEGVEHSNIYFSDTSFSVPITRVKTNNFSLVYRVLQSFKRKLSLKTLRLFKETAYSIAISQNPEDKILVTNLQEDTTNGLDFVSGHGAIKQSGISKKGIIGLTREDVWKNLLSIEEDYSSKDIFQGLLHLTKSSALIPLGKYFIENDKAKYDGGWIIEVPDDYTENQQNRLLEYFGKEVSEFAAYMPAISTLREFRKKYKSIDDLTSSLATSEVIKKIACLEISSIGSDKLKAFLVSVFDLPKDQTTNGSFTKLIALYDHMKYVLPAQVDVS